MKFSICIFFIFLYSKQTILAQSNDKNLEEDNPFTNPYKYKPLKAALLSAVFPGSGQIYNKKQLYIRLPIIYGGIAIFGFIIQRQHAQYIDARNALIYALDDDENTSPYDINPIFLNVSSENLLSRREFFRYQRDLTIIFSILWYGLNIAEAAVTAHLLEFNVNNDLSAHIYPSVETILYNELIPTVRMGFKFY